MLNVFGHNEIIVGHINNSSEPGSFDIKSSQKFTKSLVLLFIVGEQPYVRFTFSQTSRLHYEKGDAV